MMRRLFGLASIVCAATAAPFHDIAAQGALSTQGFGYPTGQLSTRALGTGGGLGQFDPDTPINPASIGAVSGPRMFLQYEPEYRRLSNGAASANTTTARFPLASIAIPIGARGSVGLSVASFLDRSSSTSFTREQDVGGQTVTVTETTRTLGAINDVRLAVAWTPSPRFHLGVGAHVFVGQNRVFFSQQFPDTLGFTPVAQTSTLGFTGYAGSAGITVRPLRIVSLGLTARKGGNIDSRSGDSTISEADIPDRIAAAIAYDGIPGSSISAHIGRELWSSLNGLGSDAATSVDTWEGGLGVETLGPRVAQRQTLLRLGARYRTLPFLAAESKVNELSFAAGVGAQFFRNRAAFDVTVERAARSPEASSVDAKERAYILSVGLRVRP